MKDPELLQHLVELETALHEPEVRANVARLEELLHESFLELGRSGRTYDRAEILKSLPIEKQAGTVRSQDFSLQRISDGVALLTYKSARLDERGALSRHTLRSSLWQQTPEAWKMRFHQGTPTGD